MWEKSGGKKEVWTRCDEPGLVIPGIVCGDRVELFAV